MVSGISAASITILLTCLSSYFLCNDRINCVVSNAGVNEVNGFYSAINGVYLKRGRELYFHPDVFEIITERDDTSSLATISLSKHAWSIGLNFRKELVYLNEPKHPEEFINSPPMHDWKPSSNGVNHDDGHNILVQCSGSLQDSPVVDLHGQMSNLQTLYMRPVTTAILIIISYIYYLYWSNQLNSDRYTYSYDKVWLQGEYYRIFSASLSHVDLMHLVFNAMSLYQLGNLESSFGSLTFAYLSLDLIVITMLICVGIHHVLIHQYNHEDLIHQQGLGYSCVLFAWMVAASVRMREYCPVFFLPSLCFNTMFLRLPWISSPGSGLPVNIGPFILLFVTKIIIPRSSFMGHLSGIIIGYPLAWLMLNWMTPPVLCALMLAGYVVKEKIFVWALPGFERQGVDEVNLSDFVSSSSLWLWRVSQTLTIALAVVYLAVLWLLGPWQVLFRGSVLFMLWSAGHAQRCLWQSDIRAVQTDCVTVLVLALAVLALAVLYDCSNVMSSLGAWGLLESCVTRYSVLVGGGEVMLGRATLVTAAVTVLCTVCALELVMAALLLASLQEITLAPTQACLKMLRLDTQSTRSELVSLGICSCRGTSSEHVAINADLSSPSIMNYTDSAAFAGRGQRLGGGSSGAGPPAVRSITPVLGTGNNNSNSKKKIELKKDNSFLI